MFWSVIALVFSLLLDLVDLRSLSDREKDLEILILRHQLDILERKQPHPIKPSKAEKLTLAVLTNKLKTMGNRSASQLRNVLRIFIGPFQLASKVNPIAQSNIAVAPVI